MTATARLSFWHPPSRKDEFTDLYHRRLTPLLREHGLDGGRPPDRPEAPGVFSQLFELDTPAAIVRCEMALYRSPCWRTALTELGAFFGTTLGSTRCPEAEHYHSSCSPLSAEMVAQLEPLLRYQLSPYTASPGPGRTVAAGPGRRHGEWLNLGLQDGLPHAIVSCIVEDNAGRLWFATRDSGICRHDGAEFTCFTEADGLAGNDVSSLLIDGEGVLWCATNRGLCRYDGERFDTFTVQDGLAGDFVSVMLQDRDDGLWIGTFGNGLSLYDGTGFVTYTTADGLAGNNVRSLAQDHEGRLWIGTKDQGVSRYDGERFETFTTAEGLIDNRVNCIAASRDGCVWLGTGCWEHHHSGGLNRYDGTTFSEIKGEDGQDFGEVWSILEDRDGQLWICQFGRGVTRLHQRSQTHYAIEDGLAHIEVTTCTQDSRGGLWFGTWGGGVSRYTGDEVRTLGRSDGLVQGLQYNLLRDCQDRIWIGTPDGVYLHDGASMQRVEDLPGGVWAVVEDREGRFWFGRPGGGLLCLEGDRLRSYSQRDGQMAGPAAGALLDRRGDLWFYSISGEICRFDGSGFEGFGAADGIPEGMVLACCEDRRGRLWFATTGGACFWEGRSWGVLNVDAGLPSNDVRAIFEDRDGFLWFGTNGGGLSRYDGEEFATFTTRDGLSSDYVRAIRQDDYGHLWIGTRGGGINRFDGRVFQRLTERDGLANDEVTQICQRSNGDFWIRTAGGVTVYRRQEERPTVCLDRVVADQDYGAVDAVAVTHAGRYLALEFHGVSWTTARDDMAYVYRLAGHEPDWHVTRARRVAYQDLEPGDYGFVVRAVDRDLNYSEPVAVRVRVELDARDEQIDVLEQQVRERTTALADAKTRLEEQNRRLQAANEQLSKSDQLKSDFLANVTHDLRTPLTAMQTSIDNLLEGIPGRLNDRQKSYLRGLDDQAGRLTVLVDDLLDLARIEAGELRIESMRVSVGEIAASVVEQLTPLAKDAHLTLELVRPEPDVDATADPHRLYQVFTNIVGNALKYTPAGGRVDVSVAQHDDWVTASVRDTGPGIPAEDRERVFEKFYQRPGSGQLGAGIGLSICRHLTEMHGGRIWVEDANPGSRFCFSLPAAESI